MAVSAANSQRMANHYLLVYNITMTAGWTVVLGRLIQALVQHEDVYTAVVLPLKIFQTGAILEILHSLTGLIRAPVSTTALQVMSRLFLVWGITDPIPEIRTNLSVTTMVAAWSLTEIPRYFYFAIAVIASHVPYWLTFSRYSTFIPLYPIGASSEWFTVYAALDFIKNHSIFSVYLPNRFNFSFDFYTSCVCVLVMYIPGLPHMYYHMLRQRRKYISAPSQKLDKTQ